MTEYNHQLVEERFSTLTRVVTQTSETVGILANTIREIEIRRENELKLQGEMLNKINALEIDVSKSLRASAVNESTIKTKLLIGGIVASTFVTGVTITYYGMDFIGMVQRPDTALEVKIDAIKKQIEDLKKQEQKIMQADPAGKVLYDKNLSKSSKTARGSALTSGK